MTVHQCPRCDLRFPDLPEVQSHLVDDHGIDPGDLEPRLSGAGHHVPVHREVPDPVREARRGMPQVL